MQLKYHAWFINLYFVKIMIVDFQSTEFDFS